MIDRLLSLFVAVSLALLVWLYARARDQEVLDHVPIPVEVNLAPGHGDQYSLEIVGPAQVLATFTGPPPRIRELRSLLQRDQLRVELSFSVPEERRKELKLYETLLVETSNLHTPSGVTTALVAGRNQVRIVLHKLGQRQLPVRFDSSLEPGSGPFSIEPVSVLVQGPLEILERTSAMPTQPWVLRGQGRDSVPLLRELENRPIRCEPDAVRVKRVTPSQRKTYELCDVPVHFLTPVGFTHRPHFGNDRAGKVTLRVVGPAQDEPPHVQAFVDLTARGFSDAGNRTAVKPRWFEEPVQFQLPRDFELADDMTRLVTFELVPPDEATPRLEMPRGDPP